METKKVTLENGTVLEVGKKYKQTTWDKANFEFLAETENQLFGKMIFQDGKSQARMYSKNEYDWLPYIPPIPQKEWKTFLIEMELSDGTLCQKIERYLSESDASKHWEDTVGVKSITEVKINIELVNS